MEIGKNLKLIRTYDLTTQQEIAKALGISEFTYAQYELQYHIIPCKHLNAFANYFNVSVDYILGFTTESTYQNYRKDINKKEIGKRLREVRLELNISQAKLAKELNTSDTVISGYEIGRYLISTSNLYDICKKYNISADWLLGKIDKPKYLK